VYHSKTATLLEQQVAPNFPSCEGRVQLSTDANTYSDAARFSGSASDLEIGLQHEVRDAGLDLRISPRASKPVITRAV